MAIRWFVVVCSALLSGMVLVFCLCGATVGLGGKGEAWCFFRGYLAWMDGKKRHHQAMGGGMAMRLLPE